MRRERLLGAVAVAATGLVCLGVFGVARAGHEITFYPSFYPQEITLKVVDRAAAVRGLGASTLQAYVGPDPFAGGTPPAHVRYAESLGGLLTLTFDPRAAAYQAPAARCAAGVRVQRALATPVGLDFVPHPYPVTPFHPDWLSHYDLAGSAQARARVPSGGDPGGPALRVNAPAPFADTLARGGITVATRNAEATLQIADPRTLLDEAHAAWAKDGWYQAARLYGARDRGAGRSAASDLVARREAGRYANAAERVDLERRIVSALTRDCARVPVGYLVRREAYSAEYSNGVENVGWDSQAGLRSAIFLRTVKLKDFPWNGWLTLGVSAPPAAAWNPVAGFSDVPGHLVWDAVGDPALVSAPYAGDWIGNRVVVREVTPGALEIPPDAFVPDATRGALRRAGPGQRATARVTYWVRSSKFHDGTKMSRGDLLAPYAFAVRWAARDPEVARATSRLRERLAGVRVVDEKVEMRELGDVQLMNSVPVVEVYLRGEGDEAAAGAVAPPWSSVPWELGALMEEAVARGRAAFSEGEARRRRVPWLDLARDARLKPPLAELAGELDRRAFVPEALRAVVTAGEARDRWAALRRFARETGHYLVANGPYRLGKVTADTVVLGVWRDLAYPMALGSFDRFTLPLRAFVSGAQATPTGLVVTADVERIEKFERSYKITRGPFRPEPGGGSVRAAVPVAHYVVVAADGGVKAAGVSDRLEGGGLVIPLDGLARGEYRVLLAVTLGENLVNPEVRVVTWTRS